MASTDIHLFTLPILLASILVSGCHKHRAWPSSYLEITDVKISRQLISGFYHDGAQWTAPMFTVALNIPNVSSTKPGVLKVDLYFPDMEIKQLGPITFKASSDGRELGHATYSLGGSYQFTSVVAARALCTNMLPVTFTLDKFILPSIADSRELGTIVRSISLERGS